VETISANVFAGCNNLTIYAEIEEADKPSGWPNNWNCGRPVVWGATQSENDDTYGVPVSSLSGNYPNPFNPTTTISYDMAREGHVNIVVYNSKGQRVAGLVDGVKGIESGMVEMILAEQ